MSILNFLLAATTIAQDPAAIDFDKEVRQQGPHLRNIAGFGVALQPQRQGTGRLGSKHGQYAFECVQGALCHRHIYVQAFYDLGPVMGPLLAKGCRNNLQNLLVHQSKDDGLFC